MLGIFDPNPATFCIYISVILFSTKSFLFLFLLWLLLLLLLSLNRLPLLNRVEDEELRVVVDSKR